MYILWWLQSWCYINDFSVFSFSQVDWRWQWTRCDHNRLLIVRFTPTFLRSCTFWRIAIISHSVPSAAWFVWRVPAGVLTFPCSWLHIRFVSFIPPSILHFRLCARYKHILVSYFSSLRVLHLICTGPFCLFFIWLNGRVNWLSLASPKVVVKRVASFLGD